MKPINDYLTEHLTLTTATIRICGNNHEVYKCSRTGNTLINTLKPIVQYSISHTPQPVFQHHDFIIVPNVAIAEHPGKGARVRPSTAGGSRPAIIFSI